MNSKEQEHVHVTTGFSNPGGYLLPHSVPLLPKTRTSLVGPSSGNQTPMLTPGPAKAPPHRNRGAAGCKTVRPHVSEGERAAAPRHRPPAAVRGQAGREAGVHRDGGGGGDKGRGRRPPARLRFSLTPSVTSRGAACSVSCETLFCFAKFWLT